MKFQFIFVLLLFPFIISAQGTAVVVSNFDAELSVDGESQSNLVSEHAQKIVLSEGQHLLQARANGKIDNQTIIIEKSKSVVVNFTFANSSADKVSVLNNNQTPLVIADRDIDVGGTFAETGPEQLVYCFDKDDLVGLELQLLNKKGTINIDISDAFGQSVYSSNNFKTLEHPIKIERRGVYFIRISTNRIFNRNIHFTLSRIPANEKGIEFNTTPKIVHDTAYQQILNTNIHVYSTANLDHRNTTTVKMSLPANTAYWTYWIGVDQQAIQQWHQFAEAFARAGKYVVSDPVLAFGLGLIPKLPVWNTTATVDYYFMDTFNAQIFCSGTNQRCSAYNFKRGNNVSSDYCTITHNSPTDLNLCFKNNSTLIGHDVLIKAYAFSIKQHYEVNVD